MIEKETRTKCPFGRFDECSEECILRARGDLPGCGIGAIAIIANAALGNIYRIAEKVDKEA